MTKNRLRLTGKSDPPQFECRIHPETPSFMKLLIHIAIIAGLLANVACGAVAFYIPLQGEQPAKAVFILNGQQLEYRLTSAHALPSGVLRMEWVGSGQTESLGLSGFQRQPGGSGCGAVVVQSGSVVVNGNDLTAFHSSVTRDDFEQARQQGYCDALVNYWVASGTIQLTPTQASAISRGALEVSFPDVGRTGYLPAAVEQWAGICRDVSGKPLANLNLHFWRPDGNTLEHRQATASATGTWSIELPVGLWKATAKPADLLARGYFCFPGFSAGQWGCFSIVALDSSGGATLVEEPCPSNQLPVYDQLWGPGLIEWASVDPGNGLDQLIFTAVPTRPTLAVSKSPGSDAYLQISFETQQSLPMALTRQWRIERSTDLQHWTPMQTVALGQSSPIGVWDPGSSVQSLCHYRAVMVEDLIATP